MPVVLFDLDGTLIDTGRLYFESYSRAFEAELGKPIDWAEMARRQPASERHFLLEWFGPEVGDRIHARMCDAYEELAATHLGGFYEGVAPMLESLRARKIRMGLVTGKSRRAFEATCRHLPMAAFFELVVVEDDVPAPKPDPSGLLRALEHFGVPPHEAVYVGDTPADIEAARRASIFGASALWARAHEDRERIAAQLEPAVWVLRSPDDLAARLR